MGLKQDIIAAVGEFVGTTLFLFLAFGGAKTAHYTQTSSQMSTVTSATGNQTIMYTAVSFGMSLLVIAWVFYRITGGLFNPAVTLALWLIGGLTAFRACLLVLAQLAGGIAGAGLVAALTPFGGVDTVTTTLSDGVNIGQGLFIEAFLTATLVLTVLFLAAEKHKATHMAPIGIGLVLFVDHLVGIAWTGCGINPARSLGPAVISASFPGSHWIYWVGPLIGSLMSVGFYLFLKAFDYTSVVFGQDADHELSEYEKEMQTEHRHPVGSSLFHKGKDLLVVYHPHRRERNLSGVTKAGSPLGGEKMLPTHMQTHHEHEHDESMEEIDPDATLGRTSAGHVGVPMPMASPSSSSSFPQHMHGSTQVMRFDSRNEEMMEALRNGEASLVDPGYGQAYSHDEAQAHAQQQQQLGLVGAPPLTQAASNTTEASLAQQPMILSQQPKRRSLQQTSATRPSDYPSMRPAAQNMGAVEAPGTYGAGLAASARAQNILAAHAGR